jgi:uncharacterized RDD family membrane protein YckC
MSDESPNPYSPPVSDPLPPSLDPALSLLASPMTRLGSALVDGIINAAIFYGIRFILFALGMVSSVVPSTNDRWAAEIGTTALGLVIFYAVQWHLLSSSGQTIGKKLSRIKIVTMQGEKPNMTDLALKRYGVIYLLNIIPIAGPIIGLVDTLCIFRKDRRCLHDLLAGTQVVKDVA